MKKGHENLVLFLAVVALVTLAIGIIATQHMPGQSANLAKPTTDTTTTVTTTTVTQAALAAFDPSPPVTGAIFTTTPDGSIVNENVHYEAKKYVYLDGGPPPNAPAKAAGLKEGYYVFQITDPSGHYLLSEDPAKCRIIRVSSDGVIVELVNVSDLGLGYTDTYEEASKGQGNGPNKDVTLVPCHVQDDPDGVAGESEKHDTNNDTDYGGPDKYAIVVQMMPFLDTPNPGGVYKAWVTPLQSYLDNGGDLNETPSGIIKKRGKDQGFPNDPGFGPARSDVKTDNFKVREKKEVPVPILRVIKFHDENANGIWDAGEPEIGIDECIDTNGMLGDCVDLQYGGWEVNITDPNTFWDLYYTRVEILASEAGTYTVEEKDVYPNWNQSAAFVDDVAQSPLNPVDVTVTADYKNEETHEVVFGNYMPVNISGMKFIDMNGNGVKDEGEGCPADLPNNPGCEGVTIYLNGTDNMGNSVNEQTTTDSSGYYEFTNVVPGTYNITVNEPNEFYCSYIVDDKDDILAPEGCQYINEVFMSGDKATYDFGDLSKAEIDGYKYEDVNGNGQYDNGDFGLPGVTVNLSGTDGLGNDVEESTTTDSNGYFIFDELWPGTYTVTEEVPDGYVASTVISSGPHTLTSDNITHLGYVFGNFEPAQKHGLKFIDLDADGVYEPPEENCANVDSQHEPGCENVNITLDGIDGKGNIVHLKTQTGSDGSYSFLGLSPGEYTVAVEDPEGFYCSYPETCEWEIILESGDNETGNNFGDFLPVNISAHKFFDFDHDGIQNGDDQDMEGVLICLNYSNGDPVTYDLDNNPIESCKLTDVDGDVEWNNLKPGSYILTVEETEPGVCGTTPTQKTFPVESGETFTWDFGNFGACYGLTPGYWKNWDVGNPPYNHYTEAQFENLTIGTIAGGDVDLAEQILSQDSCTNPEYCLAKFVLANQLTLNLASYQDYPSGGGNLFEGCWLVNDTSAGTLGDTLDIALEILIDPGSYSDSYILEIKDILDDFANQKIVDNFCSESGY